MCTAGTSLSPPTLCSGTVPADGRPSWVASVFEMTVRVAPLSTMKRKGPLPLISTGTVIRVSTSRSLTAVLAGVPGTVLESTGNGEGKAAGSGGGAVVAAGGTDAAWIIASRPTNVVDT